MYTEPIFSNDTPNIDIKRMDDILVFEQSVGWIFRIKDTNITDMVKKVNRRLLLVTGKLSSYHIDHCELTGEEGSSIAPIFCDKDGFGGGFD